MKVIEFYTTGMTLGLNSHNTVSSGADNGANNCMAGRLYQCMRHSTTQQMAANLEGRLSGKIQECIVGGHGYDGLLETGAGQSGGASDAMMYTWNAYMWEQFLARLKPFGYPILTIYSCYTGAGEDGADFLFELAKITGHPTRARTGLTSCGSNGITFQAGSSWQVATPTHRPVPIPRTTLFIDMAEERKITVRRDKTSFELTPDDVDSVEVRRVGSPAGFVSLSSSEASGLASIIFGSTPIEVPGELLIIKTAVVLIKTTNKDVPALEFDIFGDQIAQETASGDMFYLPSGIGNLLNFRTGGGGR